MKRITVNWQTFEECIPAKGARIVAEVSRPARDYHAKRNYRHTGECVTGRFEAHLRNGGDPLVCIESKHGNHAWLPTSARWYERGTEKVETRP